MAGNCMLSQLFKQILPHAHSVKNQGTILERGGHLCKHLHSVYSVALGKCPVSLVPMPWLLIDNRKTNLQGHHPLNTQESLQYCQNYHTSTSGTRVISATATPGLLGSRSLPKLNKCYTRGLQLGCQHRLDSETKTSTSVWVQSNAKPRQQSRDVVFTEHILETLCPPDGSVVLDMTFGSGGHTEEILKRNPGVKVIAVDRDPVTKIRAEELRDLYPNRLCYLNIKFSEVPDALTSIGVCGGSIWGAVLDAGPSYEQLTLPQRGGFCATTTKKLDLRMDGTSSKSLSALDVLQNIDYDSLRTVLRSYGQSKHSRKVADALINARYQMIDIRTPADLINFVAGVVGDQSDGASEKESHVSDGHQEGGQAQKLAKHNLAESAEHIPATAARIFQALRILVNDELNELDCAMRVIHYLLRPNAPFAVITYNALEHTIIKRHFTGRNVDTSVNQIGRPQHRSVKMASAEVSGDCRPWVPQKVLVTRWGQSVRHPQWKHGELRLARKNAAASYDIQTRAEAIR